MRFACGVGGCLVVASWALAQPIAIKPATTDDGKLIEEVWHTAALEGHHAGYVKLTVKEFDRQGTKIYRAAREMNLTLRRYGDIANVVNQAGTDELADGRVLGTFMTQSLGRNIVQSVQGKIDNGMLSTTAEGQAKFQKSIPWNPQCLGVLGEMRLIEQRKPKPGDRFDYLTFEPLVNAIVKVQCVVEGTEELTVGKQRPTLLRVIATPEPIQGVQLPGGTFWYDAAFRMVRNSSEMPGIGRLVIERSTREEAMKPPSRDGVDIGLRQSIILKRRIDRPFDCSEIVWRVTLPGEKGDVSSTFSRDNRQTLAGVKGQTFDLRIKAVRQPPATEPANLPPVGKEFTESNYYITSADPRVQQHARAAVGDAQEPWEKAKRVERWVNSNMRAVNFTEAMAPAYHVAESLSGDCTEFAMLAAAMCRAVGIPSRTAIGLVYVDSGPQRPAMLGFHMWTEVYVRGQWMGLDATLGRGGVGPGHVKISDHSWYETRTQTPILPLMRVMLGKPAVEVIEEVR